MSQSTLHHHLKKNTHDLKENNGIDDMANFRNNNNCKEALVWNYDLRKIENVIIVRFYFNLEHRNCNLCHDMLCKLTFGPWTTGEFSQEREFFPEIVQRTVLWTY